MRSLAIITTHPIQYNAPLFKQLSERGNISCKVFYTWGQTNEGLIYDPGFNKNREWDIPLLEGYEFEFIHNSAKRPGSDHFFGIINKTIIDKIHVYKPDAILVFGWSFYSHLKVMRYFKGKIPVIFRGDSNLIDEAGASIFNKIARRIFLRWVYKHIDIALYVGVANKRYYESFGLESNKLVFAPHCIDNHRFSENNASFEEQANSWRTKMNILESDIVFLFAGKLQAKKNPQLLIDAFQCLKEKNIKLLFVGNGEMEVELKEKAKGDERILFLNFINQSQMPIVYRMGDVFVLPSIGPGETWGLSVNEAMACGRPVIVSDACGSNEDLVIEGITGYSFKSNQLQDILNKISLMLNKETIGKMGVSAKSHIEKYHMNLFVNAIEKSMQDLAGQ